jgi:hypothetical protein
MTVRLRHRPSHVADAQLFSYLRRGTNGLETRLPIQVRIGRLLYESVFGRCIHPALAETIIFHVPSRVTFALITVALTVPVSTAQKIVLSVDASEVEARSIDPLCYAASLVLLVRDVGIEPTSSRLKGECISISANPANSGG